MPDKNTLTQEVYNYYNSSRPGKVSSFENFQKGMNEDEGKRRAVYDILRREGALDDTWNYEDFTASLSDEYNPQQPEPQPQQPAPQSQAKPSVAQAKRQALSEKSAAQGVARAQQNFGSFMQAVNQGFGEPQEEPETVNVPFLTSKQKAERAKDAKPELKGTLKTDQEPKFYVEFNQIEQSRSESTDPILKNIEDKAIEKGSLSNLWKGQRNPLTKAYAEYKKVMGDKAGTLDQFVKGMMDPETRKVAYDNLLYNGTELSYEDFEKQIEESINKELVPTLNFKDKWLDNSMSGQSPEAKRKGEELLETYKAVEEADKSAKAEFLEKEGLPIHYVGDQPQIDYGKVNEEAKDIIDRFSGTNWYDLVANPMPEYNGDRDASVFGRDNGFQQMNDLRAFNAAVVIENLSRHAKQNVEVATGERGSFVTGLTQGTAKDMVKDFTQYIPTLYDIAKRKADGKEILPIEEKALIVFSESEQLAEALSQNDGWYRKGKMFRGMAEFVASLGWGKSIVKGLKTLARKGLDRELRLEAMSVVNKATRQAIMTRVRALPTMLGENVLRAPFMYSVQKQIAQGVLGTYDVGVGQNFFTNEYSVQAKRNDKTIAGAIIKPIVETAVLNTSLEFLGSMDGPMMEFAKRSKALGKFTGKMVKNTGGIIKNPGLEAAGKFLSSTGITHAPVAMVQLPVSDIVSALSVGDWEKIKSVGTKEYWEDMGALVIMSSAARFGFDRGARLFTNKMRGFTTSVEDFSQMSSASEKLNGLLKKNSDYFKRFAEGGEDFERMWAERKQLNEEFGKAYREKLDEYEQAKKRYIDAKDESSAEALKKRTEELRKELEDYKTVGITISDLTVYGLYAKGMTEGMGIKMQDAIGDFENMTDRGGWVTIIKSRTDNNIYFLLDNKGDVSVVRGMTKDSQPFTLKENEYDVLASTPKESFTGRVASLGMESGVLMEAIKGLNDKDIQEYNAARPYEDPSRQNNVPEEERPDQPGGPSGETGIEVAPQRNGLPEAERQLALTEGGERVTPAERTEPVTSAPPAVPGAAPALAEGQTAYIGEEPVTIMSLSEDGQTAIVDVAGNPMEVNTSDLRPTAANAPEAAEATVEQTPGVENTVGEASVGEAATGTPTADATAGEVAPVTAGETAPVTGAPAAETERPPLPMQKNGEVDYNTLLQDDPARFIEEWDKVEGPGAGVEAIMGARESVNSQIEKLQKTLEKPSADFNKRAADRKKLQVLQARKDAMDKALEPYEKAVDKIDEAVANGDIPGLGDQAGTPASAEGPISLEDVDIQGQETAPETQPDNDLFNQPETPSVDFNQLMAEDPAKFIEEYDKRFGEGMGKARLATVSQSLGAEIANTKRALDRTKDMNKAAELQDKIENLFKQKRAIDDVLNPVVQMPQGEVRGAKADVAIAERWTNAPKVDGYSQTRTLPDGTKLKGHWVLTEAGAATPSHDPYTLLPSEGFPTSAAGTTVNDNDYSDKFMNVQTMAQTYDGRALDNPVFVKDGVVVSGNNRTMSGIVAADRGWDGAYVEELGNRAQSYGFTPEQIAQMRHPRVYFEIDDDFAFTTENFSKFNARDTKSKSLVEKAVNATKRDLSRVTSQIVSEVFARNEDGSLVFPTLADVYKSRNAQLSILGVLMNNGIINRNEMPDYFNEKDGTFTQGGREFLESILVGSVLNEESVKILSYPGTRQYRAAILKAMPELLEMKKIKDNILDDINAGLSYLYEANRKGMAVELLFRTNDLFNPKKFSEGGAVSSMVLEGGPEKFRLFTSAFNTHMNGGVDLFTGQEPTKEGFYEEYGRQKLTEKQRRALADARETNRIIAEQEELLREGGEGVPERRAEGNSGAPEGQVQEVRPNEKAPSAEAPSDVLQTFEARLKDAGEFNGWKGAVELYLTQKEIRDLKKAGVNVSGMGLREAYDAVADKLGQKPASEEEPIRVHKEFPEPQPRQAVRDAVIDKIRDLKVDVFTDEKVGQEVCDIYVKIDKLRQERKKTSDAQKIAEIDSQIAGLRQDVEKLVGKDVSLFRGPGGWIYGFTADDRIFIDPNAPADTPIHEYTHLWAKMFRKINPKEWKNIIALMKKAGEGTWWKRIKEAYPELKTDSEIAEEVLAHYSGARGARRIREEMERIRGDKGMPASMKMKALQALHNLRMALDKFWKTVAEYLGIKFTTAEEVADRVLADIDRGINPKEVMKRVAESDRQVVKAKEVLDYFNSKGFKDGQIVRSITDHGVSTYIEGSWGLQPYTKYRISDHGMGTYRQNTEISFRYDTKPETLYRMSAGWAKYPDGRYRAAAMSGEEQQKLAAGKSEYDRLWEQHKDKFEGLKFGKWQSPMDMKEALEQKPFLRDAKYLQQRVNSDGTFTYEFSEPGRQTPENRPSVGMLRAIDGDAITPENSKNIKATEIREQRELNKVEPTKKEMVAAAKKAMPETKIVDKNGDPMVVYHDTNSKIYVNKETGENWDNLDWKDKQEWEKRDDWDKHWEERDFYVFDNKNHGRQSIEMPAFFFSPKADPYHEYGERRVSAFLNIKNPAINPEIENAGVTNTAGRDAMNKLIAQGYDGIIRTNDAGEIEEIAAFYPEQIKSADAVTYDDEGNPIPLEDRFDTSKDDIRFSKDLEGRLDKALDETGEKIQAAKDTRKAKLDEMDGKIKKVNKGLVKAAQREYDKATVQAVTDLAKELLSEKLIDPESIRGLKSMLTTIGHVTGRESIRSSVMGIMNIVASSQIKNQKEYLQDLLKTKGVKTNSNGVKVQGRVGLFTQELLKALNKSIGMEKEDVQDLFDNAVEDYRKFPTTGNNGIYAGYKRAMEYIEDARSEQSALKVKETEIEAKRKEMWSDYEANKGTEEGSRKLKAYKEFLDASREEMLRARLHLADASKTFNDRLTMDIEMGKLSAKAFKEADLKLMDDVRHDANSDMKFRVISEQSNPGNFATNNPATRVLLSSLPTFEMFMKFFGRRSTRGEGALYNRFVRGLQDAEDVEFTNLDRSLETIKAKGKEIFGKKRGLAQAAFWSERGMGIKVKWLDAGQEREFEISQGIGAYIHAVNKMTDGKMHLRAMGITEEDVAAIEEKVDPKFIRFIDYLQDEFLPDMWRRMNEVHERVFGASLPKIEHYFPLRINKNALVREETIEDDGTINLPSTITGNIKSRTKNVAALDLKNCNAFSVALQYMQEMEHWAAYVPMIRQMNILLSYKRFRNAVKGMVTAYGSGENTWKTFAKCCRLAAGVYHPLGSDSEYDKYTVNLSKSLAAAKIALRIYTGFKQLFSAPAYLSDANIAILAKNISNPVSWVLCWNWCYNNLPNFKKRWKSRIAGETRLLPSDKDWAMWSTKLADISSKIGLTPNAFVDALTVSIGAKSIYETRLRNYKKMGYPKEKAEAKARQDAEVAYNETQQSSGGMFVSPIQIDRTAGAFMRSTFRNASFAYERQMIQGMRNLRNMARLGEKEMVDFMTKQAVKEGADEAKARKYFKREYKRAWTRESFRVALFGYGMQFAWYAGAAMPYFIWGKDKKKKQNMLETSAVNAMFGPIEGLPYGGTISSWGTKAVMGDQYAWRNPKVASSSVLGDDIDNAIRLWGSDQMAAANETINLIVQMGIGVNPQTVWDVYLAVEDAVKGDPDMERETLLCMMRVLQVPQSQINEIMIDEMGLPASKCKELTVKEFAERYARYKTKRSAFLTRGGYSEDKEAEVMGRYEKQFKKYWKERIKLDEGEDAVKTKTLKQLKAEADAALKAGDQEGYENAVKGYRSQKTKNAFKNAKKKLQAAINAEADPEKKAKLEKKLEQLEEKENNVE